MSYRIAEVAERSGFSPASPECGHLVAGLLGNRAGPEAVGRDGD
jgi:hypothetical protein